MARIPFDQDVIEGYLASDNVLNWKVAEFLNTTGFPISSIVNADSPSKSNFSIRLLACQ